MTNYKEQSVGEGRAPQADVFDMPPHPAAELFPLMPDEQIRELAEDIGNNGQHQPVVILDGHVLDGRNRLAACKLAGVSPVCVRPDDIADPVAYVLSVNLHRRHLTAEQRRGVIASVLKYDPKRSNRRVAEETKADHKTVGAVRKALESTGEIPQLAKTTGRDGKARSQPKRPAKAAEKPRPAAVAHAPAPPANGGITHPGLKVRSEPLDDLGDIAAEPGSYPWAVAVRNELRMALRSCESDHRNVEFHLRSMQDFSGYKVLRDRHGRPFATFEAFCAEEPPHGLGRKPEDAGLPAVKRGGQPGTNRWESPDGCWAWQGHYMTYKHQHVHPEEDDEVLFHLVWEYIQDAWEAAVEGCVSEAEEYLRAAHEFVQEWHTMSTSRAWHRFADQIEAELDDKVPELQELFAKIKPPNVIQVKYEVKPVIKDEINDRFKEIEICFYPTIEEWIDEWEAERNTTPAP